MACADLVVRVSGGANVVTAAHFENAREVQSYQSSDRSEHHIFRFPIRSLRCSVAATDLILADPGRALGD